MPLEWLVGKASYKEVSQYNDIEGENLQYCRHCCLYVFVYQKDSFHKILSLYRGLLSRNLRRLYPAPYKLIMVNKYVNIATTVQAYVLETWCKETRESSVSR